MAGITRFEEIEAWKTARQLTNLIYGFGNQTGFNRDFGLRDQIRRAGVSIMSNAAEPMFNSSIFLEWQKPRRAK